MTEEKKKPINVKIDENSFELSLRILSNEFVAIKIGSTNFPSYVLQLCTTGTTSSHVAVGHVPMEPIVNNLKLKVCRNQRYIPTMRKIPQNSGCAKRESPQKRPKRKI